jgi:hypothetical protein
MGYSARKETGAWTFDSLVRAIKKGRGGAYRLLPVRERERVLTALQALPAGQQCIGIGHYSFWHAASRDCELCRYELCGLQILNILAANRRKGIEHAA